MRKRKPLAFLLALLFVLHMLPANVIYAADTALNTELLTNGGGESASIAGWTDDTGQGRWSSGGVYSNWAPPTAGSYYFYLFNPSMDYPLPGTMSQQIALSGSEGSGLFADIAAGKVAFKLSVNMYQNHSADNEAKVILEEYSAAGTLLKTSQAVNTTVSGAVMGSYQINAQLDPATRKFKVLLSATLTRGGYAQFDQVSLQLLDASAGSPPVLGSNFPTAGTTDAGVAYTANFSVSDPDPGDLAKLVFSAASSNINLVPAANITIGGSGGSRTLTIRPAGNLSGEADITVTVSDGTKSASKTLHLVVNKVISMETNLVENGNGAGGLTGWSGNTVNITPTTDGFTTNDPSSSMSQNLDVSKFSSLIDGGETEFLMTAAFPSNYGKVTAQCYSDIACTNPLGSVFTINNAGPSLQQKLPANTKGVKITFSNTRWDYTNIIVRNISFKIVNNFPKIAPISPQTTKLSQLTVPVYAYYTTAGATLTAVSGDQAIVPNGSISVAGSGFNRSLSFTPLKNGNTTISLTLYDGSKSATGSFSLTVNEPAKITNLSLPAAGFYTAGGNLDFTATFDYPVTGGTASRLPLTVGGLPVFASYLSATANSITYRYTLSGSDAGVVAIAGAINDVGSPINDMAGYKANTSISTGSAGVTAVPAPNLSSTAVGASAIYGDKITFSAALNCPVDLAGSIQFKADGVALGSPVAVSANTASYETAANELPAGALTLSAEFTPSGSDVHFAGLTSNAYALTVRPKEVAIEDFAGQSRAYDGTKTVVLSSGRLTGTIAGDDISAVYPATGAAAFKGIGSHNVAFTPILLTGAQKDNYSLAAQPVVSVTIWPKPVTALASVGSKDYDGNNSADVNLSFAAGDVYPDDTLSLAAAGSFDSKDAGSGKPVTLSSIVKSGADADNYDVTIPSGLTAAIRPRNVEITAEPAAKTAGDPDPLLNYRISGGSLAAAETLAGSLSRAAGEAVGEYAITQGTVTSANNPNYNITFIPGALMTITPIPIIDAIISPTAASFDKKTTSQTDVQTTITWGSAGAVTEIKAGVSSIDPVNYSVAGSTLTIKKEYLAAQPLGSLELKISFDQGNSAILTIMISDTTPPSISPRFRNYDLNAPTDITTTITWRNARSVTDMLYGTTSLISPDDYTAAGDLLTIHNNYLSGLRPAVGDTLIFAIIFDTGDSESLTVPVVNGYLPSSNADLSELLVNGTAIKNFDPATIVYDVILPYGTVAVGVTAAAADAKAGCSVTQASALPGSATVKVTAENGRIRIYTINFTVAAPPAVYTITLDAGGGSVSPASLQTGIDGKLASLPTPTRSGRYTFDGWYRTAGSGPSGGSAVTADTVFTADTTIYAHWTYSGGSSHNDDNDDNDGGTGSPVNSPAGSGPNLPQLTIIPPTQPGQGITAIAPITADIQPGGGIAQTFISDGLINAAIADIQAVISSTVPGSGAPGITLPGSMMPGSGLPANAIPASGIPASGIPASGEGGIILGLNVATPPGATSLSIGLDQNGLQSLINAGLAGLAISGESLSLTFDRGALQEIQQQSNGDVTISFTPATGLPPAAQALIGSRPAYDVAISYINTSNGQLQQISSFGGGSASFFIPYQPAIFGSSGFGGSGLGGGGLGGGGFGGMIFPEAPSHLFGVYVDGNGQATAIPGSFYDPNRGGILIPSNHLSVYGVGYIAPSAKFSDITQHWAKESIDYTVGRGLFSGATANAFSPDTAMSRGMLAAVLGRLAAAEVGNYSASSFIDVPAGSGFQPYIEWAYTEDIIQGIGNGRFAPDRNVSRQEMAAIILNYSRATGYRLPLVQKALAFADENSVGGVYRESVRSLHQAGILAGAEGDKFRPQAGVTRAEAAAILHRYIKLTIDPATAEGWALNDAGQWLYYKDGKALTNTQTIEGVKYSFSEAGVLETGWVKDGDDWRYYQGNKLITGQQ